ncbi:hypothetical protein [Lactococcus lactis]|uniref:Uncharacterized protein n=1 Tax=Lactococcus lactis TaxID=1358 RepID=A0AB35KFK5_9LACT|nr:hypothetical protein [Lactococcus lactis]MDG5049548.1 hypothetical protein [Lactococcus lactis]
MEQLSNQFYALCERDENKIALEFKSTNNSTQEGMIGEALESMRYQLNLLEKAFNKVNENNCVKTSINVQANNVNQIIVDNSEHSNLVIRFDPDSKILQILSEELES